MKRAILQKVPGLQLVKWRLMKASYGLVLQPIFVPGEHDEKRKFQDKVDGNIRCRDVMRWCAVLVIIGNLTGMLTAGTKVEDEHQVRHTLVQHYSRWKYRVRRKLPLKCSVLGCVSENPPKYKEWYSKFTDS
jgi:hypothetical protein